MKKQYISFLILVVLLCQALNIFAQGKPRCNQGAQQSQLPDSSRVFLPDSCIFSGHFPSVGANDPNEIVGPAGFQRSDIDTTRWLSPNQRLNYTIYFENDPTLASAPAQRVEIRMPIASLMNTSSVSIGSFGFNNQTFTVEGSHSSYQQRLDLRSTIGLYVDVVAGLDLLRNEIVWVLQSIDTATGLPPTGLYQGFLPVNTANHEGEGYVTFSVLPRAAQCHTGDTLSAQASIVFDINPAIATNRWRNIFDAAAPTSQLSILSFAGQDSIVFSGGDDANGCGLKQYRLYRSENGGAYRMMGTYSSAATIPTQSGVQYSYYCLAEDFVGNVEVKDSADAQHGVANIQLALQAFPAQAGTVTGGGIMAAHSSATITATPATGYHFVRWANSGITVSTSASYQFNPAEDMMLTAFFEPNQYTLTIQQAEGVAIEVASAKRGLLVSGNAITHFDTLQVSFQVQPCYDLTSFTLNGAAIQSGAMTPVVGDVAILSSSQLQSHDGIDLQVACESYTWIDGQSYTASTTAPQHHLSTSDGCDSVVTLHLTVGYPTHDTISASIQQGETYSEHGFVESQAGTYTHTFTSQEGCDSTITLVLTVSQVGVDENLLNPELLSVVPNPTTGKVVVSWQGVAAEHVEVMDMVGRMLLDVKVVGAEVRLDLSDYPDGSYLVRLVGPEGVAIKKIVKQ